MLKCRGVGTLLIRVLVLGNEANENRKRYGINLVDIKRQSVPLEIMDFYAKAIVNLVDFACIMSRPTKTELNELSGIADNFGFMPNLVTDVFKNRRGRWTMVRIWSSNDLGCCRKEDLFITTADMKPINDFKFINFNNVNFTDYQGLCDLYNQGFTPNEDQDEIDDDCYQLSDIKPEELLKNAAAAFEDAEDNKKRNAQKNFADFLDF